MKKYIFTLLMFSSVAMANGTYDMAKNQGCESGKHDSGETWHKFDKDVDRYIKDDYYKTGWDDGYRKCKSEADNLNNIINDSLNRGW
jgi:hypothetical protein